MRLPLGAILLAAAAAAAEHTIPHEEVYFLTAYDPSLEHHERLEDVRSPEFAEAAQKLKTALANNNPTLLPMLPRLRVVKFFNEGTLKHTSGTEDQHELIIERPETATAKGGFFQLSINLAADSPLNAHEFLEATDAMGWEVLQYTAAAPHKQEVQTSASQPCDNGGNHLPNGSCACQPYFTGQFCNEWVCLNGGHTTFFLRGCHCPPGYVGLHCEPQQCRPPTSLTFNRRGRTLVFVIQTRFSMAIDTQQIYLAARQIIQQYNTMYPGWFYTYLLVSYRASYSFTFYSRSLYFHSAGFLNGLKYLRTGDAYCHQPMLHALRYAFSFEAQPNSPMFVFSDSEAEDYQMEPQIHQLAADWKDPIHFIISNITDNDHLHPCHADPAHDHYKVFFSLAKYSQGHVMQTQKTQLARLLLSLLPTERQDTTLITGDFEMCHMAHTQHMFYWDSQIRNVSVTATGGNVALGLITPSGQHMPLRAKYQNGDIWIYTIAQQPPGTYQFFFTAALQRSCSYRIKAFSGTGFYAGFSPSLGVDSLHPMPIYSTVDQIVGRIISTAGMETDLNSVQLMIYTNQQMPNNYDFVGQAFSRPGSCNYNIHFGEYICNQGDRPLWIKLVGNDTNGYRFQRTAISYCRIPPYRPPPTCQNGGTQQSDGSCICAIHFTGNLCQTEFCDNGGSFTIGAGCICPDGYYGDHCHNLQCTSSPVNFDVGEKTLSFVILSRFSMAEDTQQIIAAASYIIFYYSHHYPGYFKEYSLTTFLTRDTQNGQVRNEIFTHVTTDAELFLRQLSSVTTSISAVCNQPILRGLESALSTGLPRRSRSPVFVFTDAMANDEEHYYDVVKMNAQIQNQLYFIVTPPPDVIHCPLDYHLRGFQVLRDLAQVSQGHFFRVAKSDVYPMMNVFAPTVANTDMVSVGDHDRCDQVGFGHQTVYIENGATALEISVTGTNISVHFHAFGSPVGAILNPKYQAGNVYFYEILNPHSGGYLIDVQGQADMPCTYRMKVRSNVDMFFGFTRSPIADISYNEPIKDTPNHLVNHFTSYNKTNARVHADVYYHHAHGTHMDHLGLGTYRGQCAHEWFFAKPWTCPGDDIFHATVYVHEGVNNDFQRVFSGLCRPPDECFNGGHLHLTPNGTECHCAPGFHGLSCAYADCLNGGFHDAHGRCVCPPGFAGTHCYYHACKQQNMLPNHDPEHRSLTILVQTTITMSYDIQQIKRSIRQMSTNMWNQNFDWIQQWILVTVNNNGANTVISTSELPEFLAAVDTLQPDDGIPSTCPTHIVDGLIQALKLETSKKGIIFGFVDTKSVVHHDQFESLGSLVEQTQAQINFVMTSFNPCPNQDIRGYLRLYYAALFSGGEFLIARKSSVDSIVTEYIPRLYESDLARHQVRRDCSNETRNFTMYTEARAYGIKITVNGYHPTIKVFDPRGNMHNYTLIVNEQHGTLVVAYVSIIPGGVMAGRWVIQVRTRPPHMDPTASSSCRVAIRVRSPVQMYYGFQQDQFSDQPYILPFNNINKDNHVIASLANVPDFGHLHRIDMYTFNGSAGAIHQRLSFHHRRGCSHPFSSTSFFCPKEYFYMIFHGHDEHGHRFHRWRWGKCVPLRCSTLHGQLMNGACNCTAGWTGFDCSVPQCQNGGTVVANSVCVCLSGFAGVHCENTNFTITTTTSTQTPSMTPSMQTTQMPSVTTQGGSTPTVTTTTPRVTSPPTTGPTTTTGIPLCNHADLRLDIVFVIDASYSIGLQAFEFVRQTMKSFFSDYTIGPMNTQASFILVSDTMQPYGLLNTFTDKTSLLAAIRDMRFLNRTGVAVYPYVLASPLLYVMIFVKTFRAFNFILKEVMQVGNGYRPLHTDHVIVLMTSKSSTGPNPTPLADQLKIGGWHILGVGVGANADVAQLTGLAGGSSCVLTTPGSGNTTTLSHWLQRKTCTYAV